jgi:hypothetical protein
VEPETTSLPPDYTSQRLTVSIAPQEVQATEGQLPPMYSTAQLELMARRTASEQDAVREFSEETHSICSITANFNIDHHVYMLFYKQN